MNQHVTGAITALFVGCLSVQAAEESTMSVLTANERNLVRIGMYTAQGDMTRLTGALNQGLDEGLTVNEIKEALVQLYAYCGFPRSLNALGNFMGVVNARKQSGIEDKEGALPGPMPEGTSLAFGTANQTKLTGRAVKGALYEFAPAIDEYLKAHLFGDIFARDNLDWKTRELVTIAALAAQPETLPQRDAHIEDQATARKKESLLSLEVTMAAAKLSYACAAAIKRGEPNGEMEEAMESYEKAKSAYYHFINEQAADHLTQK